MSKNLMNETSMLDRVCKEKDIDILFLKYPMRKCITFFPDINLLIVANNCRQKQIESITVFILNNSY